VTKPVPDEVVDIQNVFVSLESLDIKNRRWYSVFIHLLQFHLMSSEIRWHWNLFLHFRIGHLPTFHHYRYTSWHGKLRNCYETRRTASYKLSHILAPFPKKMVISDIK